MTGPPSAAIESWLGGWPPALPVAVVADPTPGLPGWDGGPRGIAGCVDPSGRVLVRVPPSVAGLLQPADLPELLAALPAAVGRPGTAGVGALRWAQEVPELPDAGVWMPTSDPRVPPWLLPFGGEALVALDDDGAYVAGVGLKRHTDALWEISVVTDERARGRGLARRLVAQAARRVLAEGRDLLYLHAPDNAASAAVARASGFPDTGWQVVGFWERTP